MEKFKKLIVPLCIVIVAAVLLVIVLFTHNKNTKVEEEEEVVEIEAIEEIFRQATDLVEESDFNPRN